MSRTSTSHFPPLSTHPSRYTNPHHQLESVSRPCGIVTAAQLLVYSRAAARAAHSAKDRARVAAALGSQLGDLLARIEQSPDAVLYARAFELLQVGAAPQDAAAGVDATLLGTLVELSDLLLDLCTPCRADARPRRRPGIVRTGDGYPRVQPNAARFARVYRLVDERDYLIVPCMEYEVLDWDGDPHAIVAPVGDRGDGRISRDVLRAFLAMGLASLYKKCERLTDRNRRGRYADWPYPTRMPGLIAAGSKDDIVVDVVELLRVRHFDPPPSAPDDEPPSATPTVPALTPLPRGSFLLGDGDDDGALQITEIPELLRDRAAVEVER